MSAVCVALSSLQVLRVLSALVHVPLTGDVHISALSTTVSVTMVMSIVQDTDTIALCCAQHVVYLRTEPACAGPATRSTWARTSEW